MIYFYRLKFEHVRELEGIEMEIKVVFEKDEGGMYVVTCPSLPGCVSQGKTEKEALKNKRGHQTSRKVSGGGWFALIKAQGREGVIEVTV